MNVSVLFIPRTETGLAFLLIQNPETSHFLADRSPTRTAHP